MMACWRVAAASLWYDRVPEPSNIADGPRRGVRGRAGGAAFRACGSSGSVCVCPSPFWFKPGFGTLWFRYGRAHAWSLIRCWWTAWQGRALGPQRVALPRGPAASTQRQFGPSSMDARGFARSGSPDLMSARSRHPWRLQPTQTPPGGSPGHLQRTPRWCEDSCTFSTRAAPGTSTWPPWRHSTASSRT